MDGIQTFTIDHIMPATPPSLPPIPQPDRNILTWAKRLADWLKRSRPVAGSGLKGQQTSGGYILSAVPSDNKINMDYQIHLAGTSVITVPYSAILELFSAGTDVSWNAQFSVSGGSITGTSTPVGVTGTALYDGDASVPTAQTFCRIPVIRESKYVSTGGSYRENIYCVGTHGPIVELIKIG